MTYFSQDDMRIENVNTSTIAGCQMQMQLVRVDADGGRTLIGVNVDDVFWGVTFTMPTTPDDLFGEEGLDWYQYGSLEHNPWSIHHHDPRRTDWVDDDPPNGLCTYEYRWRLKLGASGLTGLITYAGKGRMQVMGAKV
jgi:hypothetical protein